MKRILLSSAIVAMTFFACKKDDTTNTSTTTGSTTSSTSGSTTSTTSGSTTSTTSGSTTASSVPANSVTVDGVNTASNVKYGDKGTFYLSLGSSSFSFMFKDRPAAGSYTVVAYGTVVGDGQVAFVYFPNATSPMTQYKSTATSGGTVTVTDNAGKLTIVLANSNGCLSGGTSSCYTFSANYSE